MSKVYKELKEVRHLPKQNKTKKPHQKMKVQLLSMGAHTWNSSTWEPEAGILLQVQSQLPQRKCTTELYSCFLEVQMASNFMNSI